KVKVSGRVGETALSLPPWPGLYRSYPWSISMQTMSLVEEELGGPTVFKDLAKLDFDYVPDSLPGRDEAIRALSSIYKGLTLGAKGGRLLVMLDEVDAVLETDGSNLVYDLTRFNDEVGPSWVGVSLLMISQENVLSLLDAAALSTFKQTNVLQVAPYPAQQLE